MLLELKLYKLKVFVVPICPKCLQQDNLNQKQFSKASSILVDLVQSHYIEVVLGGVSSRAIHK